MSGQNSRLLDEEQVSKDDLGSQLYRAIAHKIVTRILKPGERISTASIAKAYDVSVTPVREAFKRLAAEGLIQIRPRKESVVTPITADHIRHLYEIRTIIEAHAVKRKFRPDTISQMRTCLEALAGFDSATLYDDFDVYWRYSGHDGRFHRLIVAETGNPRLLEIYSNLHAHALIAPVLFGYRSADRGLEQRREHEQILQALTDGDGERASRAVVKHLDQTRDVILERWPAETDDSPALTESIGD